MTAAEIYLPCDVSAVRVRLGFGDTLSPLEEVALRVIAAAAEDAEGDGNLVDVRELAVLLGLGYRIVLDLIHDLWRAGYLTVDFSSNAIGLSAGAQEKLHEGRLTELNGVETEERVVELMVERITGYVMPARGPRAPGDPRLAIRFASTDVSLTELQPADVNRAIRSWLRFQESRGEEGDGDHPGPTALGRRGRRVLSYRTLQRADQAATERRWYKLDVQVDINEASDRLLITVVDQRFPAERREAASERLTRIAEDFPREPFVTRLRAVAEQQLVVPPSAEELLDRLQERIVEGALVRPGKRRAEHLEWAAESRRIRGMIKDRIAHEVDAEVISGGEAHAAELERLIDDVQTQLVIVSPDIRERPLERFLPRLRAAVERGVQVVIVWGPGYAATLPEPVSNELDSLARRSRRAPLLRSQVSASTHAKMVVCDNRAALVTARDLLYATRDRQELGLLLRVPPDGATDLLGDMLSWTRINLPGAISTSVLRAASRFTPAIAAAGVSADEPDPERLIEEPPEGADESGAVQAWILRWTGHVTALRRQLTDRKRPAARLVEDGAHRELLWSALTSARYRVVIASGQLSDEVVNGRMIDAIRGLLGRGVAVTIGYDGNGGAERGQGALAALTELAAGYTGLFTMNPLIGHAKGLVWDDEVVIGSYSYLFHGGYGTAGGRHMMPTELSARLASPAIADQVAAAWGQPAEITARMRADRALPHPALAVSDPQVLAAVQRIVNYAGGHPGAVVRAELAGVDDPWAVLKELDGLARPEIRRAAIAYCLATAAGSLPPGDAARWHGRLAEELIRAGLFVEAMILGYGEQAGIGADGGPRAQIRAALAGRGQPDGFALLEASMLDRLTDDERAVLLALAVGELLGNPAVAAQGVAELVIAELLPAADAAWDEFARSSLAYHEQAVGADTAGLMAQVAGQQQLAGRLDRAWNRLDIALLEANPVPVNIEGAKKTHAALLKDTGVFGRLRPIAARRDLPALRAAAESAEFLQRQAPGKLAGEILDKTWLEVAPNCGLLDHQPRVRYVERLAEVIAAVRELAKVDDQGGDVGLAPHPDLITAASELADSYQRLRGGLTACHGILAAAAAAGVCDDLDRLMAGEVIFRATAYLADDPSTGEAGNWLAGWQGQWQYPALAAALRTGVEDGQAVGLLLADLIDPLQPVEACRRLIAAGEFAAATSLRRAGVLAPADDEAMLRELLTAQDAARARVRYAAMALSRRAQRAGLGTDIDLAAVEAQAEQCASDADETLANFRNQIDLADAEFARQLRADAAGRELPGLSPEEADRWRRSVEAVIAAGELATGTSMLARDPAETRLQDPRLIGRPRSVWPFPAASAETVLAWYFEDPDARTAPPGFASWRPSPSDTDAWGMLAALRDHLGAPSADHATGLCDALQRLVGGAHQLAVVTLAGPGWQGLIYLPDDYGLPRTKLLGRDGIRVWVADPADPPFSDVDGDESGPLVWLMTDLTRPPTVPPRVAVIDLPFLFRLLAPTESDRDTRRFRLINLVRQLAAQLDADDVLAEAGGRFREPHVAWLLDLLGAQGDGSAAEAIHYDTSGRREVLVPLLDALLSPVTPGQGRHQLVDIKALNAVWDRGSWRAKALDGLLAPLANDPAARMLVWVAAAFHQDSFNLEELETGIRLAARENRHLPVVLGAPDSAGTLSEAAARLRRLGLFTEVSSQRWRLSADGMGELLAGRWPGHEPLALAGEAIADEYRRLEDIADRARAELSDEVIRMIGHVIANRQAAASSAWARGKHDLAFHVLTTMEPVHEMYQKAIRGSEPLPLAEVINDQLNQTYFMNPGLVVTPLEDAGLLVTANPWILGHVFLSLFDNASQAIERCGREYGTIRVKIASVSGAVERCRVDIEDSGPGMPDKARAAFAANANYSSHGGRGTGLVSARRWLDHYQGDLEILPGASELGGARLRITLPLSHAAGAGGLDGAPLG